MMDYLQVEDIMVMCDYADLMVELYEDEFEVLRDELNAEYTEAVAELNEQLEAGEISQSFYRSELADYEVVLANEHQLINLKELGVEEVEVIGNFVWVTTCVDISHLGFRYSYAKGTWYYCSKGYKQSKGEETDMNDIRRYYGVNKVQIG